MTLEELRVSPFKSKRKSPSGVNSKYLFDFPTGVVFYTSSQPGYFVSTKKVLWHHANVKRILNKEGNIYVEVKNGNRWFLTSSGSFTSIAIYPQDKLFNIYSLGVNLDGTSIGQQILW